MYGQLAICFAHVIRLADQSNAWPTHLHPSFHHRTNLIHWVNNELLPQTNWTVDMGRAEVVNRPQLILLLEPKARRHHAFCSEVLQGPGASQETFIDLINCRLPKFVVRVQISRTVAAMDLGQKLRAIARRKGSLISGGRNLAGKTSDGGIQPLRGKPCTSSSAILASGYWISWRSFLERKASWMKFQKVGMKIGPTGLPKVGTMMTIGGTMVLGGIVTGMDIPGNRNQSKVRKWV